MLRGTQESAILSTLRIDHIVGTSSMNGDCFYDSLYQLLGPPYSIKELRKISSEAVRSFMSENENIHMDEQTIRDIRYTHRWADDLEISMLVEKLGFLSLYICDEDGMGLLQYGSTSHNKLCACLRRKSEHYTPIHIMKESGWDAIDEFLQGRTYKVVDCKRPDVPVIAFVATAITSLTCISLIILHSYQS